jgi:hypothetical protein
MIQTKTLTPQRIWFVLLGAPVLWLVHFLLAYLYNEAACSTANLGSIDRSIPLVAGIVFAFGTLVTSLYTFRELQRVDLEENKVLLEIGFLLGLLFTLILLIETLAVYFVGGCG